MEESSVHSQNLGFGMILVCICFNRSSTARVMFGVCYVLFSDLCRRYSAINALMIMSSKEERTAVNFHHIQQREIAFAACCCPQPCSFLYGVCHTRSGNIVQEKVRGLHGWNTLKARTSNRWYRYYPTGLTPSQVAAQHIAPNTINP